MALRSVRAKAKSKRNRLLPPPGASVRGGLLTQGDAPPLGRSALGYWLIAPLGCAMRCADANVLRPYVLTMVLVQMKRLMDVSYLLLPKM